MEQNISIWAVFRFSRRFRGPFPLGRTILASICLLYTCVTVVSEFSTGYVGTRQSCAPAASMTPRALSIAVDSEIRIEIKGMT